MNLRSMGSCAVQEISNIRLDGGPLNTMVSFCKALLPTMNKVTSYKGVQVEPYYTIYSFYIFTAAISTPGKKTPGYTDQYGRNFANFIRDNGLGEVTESPIKVNVAFHNDHSNQIFVWAVDHAGVRKWWGEYQKANATPAPPPPIEPVADVAVKAKRVYKKLIRLLSR